MFLMFSIGLEFSLAEAARRCAGSCSGLARPGRAHARSPWSSALALGGHRLAHRHRSRRRARDVIDGDRQQNARRKLELDSLHGRQVIGMLLFQDLAVVPLLILIPALAQRPATWRWRIEPGARSRRSSCSRSCCFSVSDRCARGFIWSRTQKSSELFVLNVLLITLGLAFITEMAGLIAGARRIHRRHAHFGDRIPLSGRGRHQAVPRRVAGIVFRDDRHEARYRARL